MYIYVCILGNTGVLMAVALLVPHTTVYVSPYIHAYMCMCVCVCMHICMCICMYVCICIYMGQYRCADAGCSSGAASSSVRAWSWRPRGALLNRALIAP